MAKNPNPLRRVVTGHNAQGKSCVIFDSDAPNVYHRTDINAYFTDFWTIKTYPQVFQAIKTRGQSCAFQPFPSDYGCPLPDCPVGCARPKQTRD